MAIRVPGISPANQYPTTRRTAGTMNAILPSTEEAKRLLGVNGVKFGALREEPVMIGATYNNKPLVLTRGAAEAQSLVSHPLELGAGRSNLGQNLVILGKERI